MKSFIILALLFGTICVSTGNVDDILKRDKKLFAFYKMLDPANKVRTDIVVLMDESGSVVKTHFPQQKLFLEILGRWFNVGSDEARFAVITFANYGRYQFGTIENRIEDLCSFLKKLRALQTKGGFTNPSHALNVAEKTLKHSTASRKYIIMLSDGCKNLGSDPVPIAQALKKKGIVIFGVTLNNVCRKTMDKMVTSSKHMYHLEDKTKLTAINNAFKYSTSADSVKEVTMTICQKKCKGGKNCCDENAICSCQSDGEYRCSCTAGYTGSGYNGRCLKCLQGTFGTGGTAKCSRCPANSNTTHEGSTSVNQCKCNVGYSGKPAKNKQCEFGKCPKLKAPIGGVLDPPSCGRSLNDSCSFWCKEPYCPYDGSRFNCLNEESRKLQNKRVCLATARWSGPEMKCEIARCSAPDPIEHGEYVCTGKNFAVGTKCKAKCLDGFQLTVEAADIICERNGSWSHKSLVLDLCQTSKCPPLKFPPQIYVDPESCNQQQQEIGTKCKLSCQIGYKLVHNSLDSAVSCDIDGTWKPGLENFECRDFLPPKITCPESIVMNNDELLNTKLISWTIPSTNDNDRHPPKSSLISPEGIKSPHAFQIGIHNIIYEAIDVNGLKSTCEFNITVIDNEPPLVISCPENQEIFTDTESVGVDWDEPQFSDNSGHYFISYQSHKPGNSFSAEKSETVVYKVSDEAGSSAVCQFNVFIKNYQCPFRRPPANGKIECQLESNGQKCTASCNSGYELLSAAKTYSCTFQIDDYRWEDNELWTDCAETVSPSIASFEGRLSFESNNCIRFSLSDDKKKEIETSVEKVLQTDVDVCKSENNCKLKLLFTDCLAPSSTSLRRKRSDDDDDEDYDEIRTNEDFLTVFNFEIFVDDPTLKSVEISSTAEEEISEIFRQTLEENLDLKNMSTKISNNSQLTCRPGEIFFLDTCLQCPMGMFYTSNNNSCTKCPVNTYQDLESSLDCKPCPDGYVTFQSGATDELECFSPCNPGSYSSTGYQPCRACPVGSFQNEVKQISCVNCPAGKTTWSFGAFHDKFCAVPCEAGSFSPTGLEPCKKCPQGTYQSKEQQRECIPCSGKLTTEEKGSYHVSLCIDIDVCEPNPCMNGGKCSTQDNKRFSCDCATGFFGWKCEIKFGDFKQSDSLFCDDRVANCSCKEGFTGENCEENIDDCAGEPCVNGGTCQDGDNSFVCICPDGLNGQYCEINYDDCEPDSCQNGGTCKDQIKGFSCCCPAGFTGERCEREINDCDENPCLNSATCRITAFGHECDCALGFQGPNCESKVDYCKSQPCANEGICTSSKIGFSCSCRPGYAGNNCETIISPDFDINFASPTSSDYAEIKINENLYALTISFWMKTNENFEANPTPISYSYQSPKTGFVETNGLTWYNANKFTIYLAGIEIKTDIYGSSDQKWHHYTLTWESVDGSWKIYSDGEIRASGIEVSIGEPLWSGYLIVGQDQNSLGGQFGPIESFTGSLSQINIWDFAMTPQEVRELYKTCGLVGNVFAWSEIKTKLHGSHLSVTSSSTVCADVSSCGKHYPECFCHFNKLHDISLCQRSVSSCQKGSCQNNQQCVIVNRSLSYCECNEGFSGRTCEYDVNECVENNGGCEQECTNAVGSYKCSCYSGYSLSSDRHKCDPLSQCKQNGHLYADKEEWQEGCDVCRCQKGKVVCRTKKCSKLSCSKGEAALKLPGNCCPQCVDETATCIVTAGNTIKTFDNNRFPFDNRCRFTLAKDCSGGSFAVEIERGITKQKTKKVIIKVGCQVLELNFNGELFVDGQQEKIPFRSHEVFGVEYYSQLMETKQKESNVKKIVRPFIVITMNLGITVSWSKIGAVDVTVPKEMFRKTCGLCGDYNGVDSDDWQNRDYELTESFTEFILSWKDESIPCAPPIYEHPAKPKLGVRHPSCLEDRRKWMEAFQHCEVLREQPFEDCYDSVVPNQYYQLCVQDACMCSSSPSLCHCDAILAYESECRKKKISVNGWNGQTECGNRCENGTEYQTCGPACVATCSKMEEIDPRCQIEICRAGCHCPDGLVMHEKRCIPSSECPNNI